MKLGDLLNTKDTKYRVAVTVQPGETVMAVVHKLVKHDRGSIMVCNDGTSDLEFVNRRYT